MLRPVISPLDSASTQALLRDPVMTRATPVVSNTTAGISALATSAGIDLSREDLSGCQLSHYELGARIGSGGMGQVFLARHVHLGKTFAVKFISGQLTGDKEANQRFVREFRALGRLSHPNIVAAVDAGAVSGLQYYVTEYLEGRDSSGWMAELGPMPMEAACEVVRQAALGLAFAHKAGLTHRDIKPTNLFLQANGIVKVLDFGLVCERGTGGELTSAGIVMGTLDFLSPEQAECLGQADQRSDIYSLGATLIFLLSGQPPYPDKQFPSAASKLRAHLLERPAWLVKAKQNLPRPLFDILNRMLAKQPADRFANCEEVADALATIAMPKVLQSWLAGNLPLIESKTEDVAGSRVLPRNMARLIAAAGLLSTVVVGSFFWPHSGTQVQNPTMNSQPAGEHLGNSTTQGLSAIDPEDAPQHRSDLQSAQTAPIKIQSDHAAHSSRESSSTSARAATVNLGNSKSDRPGTTRVLSAPANRDH